MSDDIKRLLGEPKTEAEFIKDLNEKTDIQVAKELVGIFTGGNREKNNINLIIIFFIVIFIAGCSTGFFIGRGDIGGLIGLKPSNRELTETIGTLRSELERERETVEGITRVIQEERRIIKSAIESCRTIGEGIQGTIKKMEILNDLIINLECRAYGSVDIQKINSR